MLNFEQERQSIPPFSVGLILKLSQVSFASTFTLYTFQTLSSVKFSQFTQPFTNLIAIVFFILVIQLLFIFLMTKVQRFFFINKLNN